MGLFGLCFSLRMNFVCIFCKTSYIVLLFVGIVIAFVFASEVTACGNELVAVLWEA